MSQQAAVEAKNDDLPVDTSRNTDSAISDLSAQGDVLRTLGEPAILAPPAVPTETETFDNHHPELPERRTNSPKSTFTALTPDLHVQSPAHNTHSQPGVLIESFMKNELYFRSLVKQRQETFQKLDSCINETASEIALCKSKNNNLAKKIRELDGMIEEDRAKWRSRVEEEKRLLMSQTNNNLGMINSLPTF